jgi:hypothetical protein
MEPNSKMTPTKPLNECFKGEISELGTRIKSQNGIQKYVILSSR